MDPAIASQIEAFFARYPTRKYRKGQILIHADDNPTHIFHLLDGRVKQYDISYRGDEVVLNMFKPPAFFPMSIAMNRSQNVYFYEADTALELQLAPVDETLQFLKSHPDVLYDLLARVYRGTEGLLGRLAHIMAATAKSRVMYELLVQARRFGEPRDNGIAIPATESDIAGQAGLARETVSREMNKLKRDGYIIVASNEIIVKDLNQLSVSLGREL